VRFRSASAILRGLRSFRRCALLRETVPGHFFAGRFARATAEPGVSGICGSVITDKVESVDRQARSGSRSVRRLRPPR